MAQAPRKPLQSSPSASNVKKGGLVALLGSLAAGLLFVSIPADEGTEYKAYRDIAGIWTICNGDTNNVKPGMTEDKAGCQLRLEQQLIAHAEPVMKCVPELRDEGRDYQRAAGVSLAYNIGTHAFCRSTVARKFRQRDWRGGCDAILLWDKARVNGKIVTVKGLSNRRQRERAVCLKGLAA